MKLNEKIVEKSEIITSDQTKLPKGILARVRYPIMRYGKINANKRIYEESVADTILKDANVMGKVKNRTLYGNMEHPEQTNIQLDKDATSHIISDIYKGKDKGLDENVLYADFDILPTDAGKFINVLLEAGCLVGVSTRADGELEECVNEADGSKYSRVIPDKYVFSTTDFTGDPSTPDVLPENIIKATVSHYESKDIDKNIAIALLERANTNESKLIEEKIKADKQHTGCNCSLSEKKCSGGCSKNEVMQVGQVVKVQECNGVVLQVFPRTQKTLVQIGTEKKLVGITECIKVEEAKKEPTIEEKVKILESLILKESKTKKIHWEDDLYGYWVDVYQDNEGNVSVQKIDMVADEKSEVPVTDEIKKRIENHIKQHGAELFESAVNETEEIKKLYTEKGLTPPDGKGIHTKEFHKMATEIMKSGASKEIAYATAMKKLGKEKAVKKAHQRNEAVLGATTSSSDISGQPANMKAAEEVAKESEKRNKETNETVELKIEIPAHIKEFLFDHWNEFIDEEDAIKNLVTKYKIDEKDSIKYVKAIEAGKGRIGLVSAMESKQINEAIMYVHPKVHKTQDGYFVDWVVKTASGRLQSFDRQFNSPEEATEFMKKLQSQRIKESIKDDIKKINQDTEKIKQVTKEIQELDKKVKSAEDKANHSEGKLKEATKSFEQKIAELTAEKNKIAENYAKDIVAVNTKLNEALSKEQLNQMLSDAMKMSEAEWMKKYPIGDYGDYRRTALSNAGLREDPIVKESQVKALEEKVEQYKKDIKVLQEQFELEKKTILESNQKEIVKEYVANRLKVTGLSLTDNMRTLFESCGTKQEVDRLIIKLQDTIRESIVHSTKLSSIVVEARQQDPQMKAFESRVAAAMESMTGLTPS